MDQTPAVQNQAPIENPQAPDDRSADQVLAGVLLWLLMIALVLV